MNGDARMVVGVVVALALGAVVGVVIGPRMSGSPPVSESEVDKTDRAVVGQSDLSKAGTTSVQSITRAHRAEVAETASEEEAEVPASIVARAPESKVISAHFSDEGMRKSLHPTVISGTPGNISGRRNMERAVVPVNTNTFVSAQRRRTNLFAREYFARSSSTRKPHNKVAHHKRDARKEISIGNGNAPEDRRAGSGRIRVLPKSIQAKRPAASFRVVENSKEDTDISMAY